MRQLIIPFRNLWPLNWSGLGCVSPSKPKDQRFEQITD